MQLSNVSNPAAIGARWKDGDSEYELAALRGTDRVIFGMRGAGVPSWTMTTVTNPERFGPIPTNWREMRTYAEAFTSRDQ